MKELEPLEMLKGRWSGKGKGTYGPFTVRVDVEERGRWLVMRQDIKVPIVHIRSYVSTQVYGFADTNLTLDYFDTAGSFHFQGRRDGDTLRFEWTQRRSTKTSTYWAGEDGSLRFRYESAVEETGSDDLQRVSFEGILTPDE
jgi:hypothetical protein